MARQHSSYFNAQKEDRQGNELFPDGFSYST